MSSLQYSFAPSPTSPIVFFQLVKYAKWKNITVELLVAKGSLEGIYSAVKSVINCLSKQAAY